MVYVVALLFAVVNVTYGSATGSDASGYTIQAPNPEWYHGMAEC